VHRLGVLRGGQAGTEQAEQNRRVGLAHRIGHSEEFHGVETLLKIMAADVAFTPLLN
jgi:hypothetical protein